MGFMSKLLSIGADKDLKRYEKTVAKINDLEPTYQKMDDDELAHQTEVFRERFAAGESLDAMLPEAFAVPPHHGPAPFRRAAHRRHGAP